MKNLCKKSALILLCSILLIGCRSELMDSNCKKQSVELRSSFVEFCPLEGLNSEVDGNQLNFESPNAVRQIQLQVIETDNFTYAQLKPPKGDQFKNIEAWRNEGLKFETEVIGIDENKSHKTNFIYPLRYATVEIEWQGKETAELELINSLKFEEKHPISNKTLPRR